MNEFKEIALELIEPNPNQPRKHFDDESLQELADSIKAKGLLEPIVVRPFGDKFQVVCGERRWRACKIAGLETIEAIVRECGDNESFEISLTENVQRDNLKPIDEALAYKAMIDKGYTQQAIADIIHKGRSYIAQKLRLLDLPDEVKDFVSRDTISEGHARQLLRIKGIFKIYSHNPAHWTYHAQNLGRLTAHCNETVAETHRHVNDIRWNFLTWALCRPHDKPREHWNEFDWKWSRWDPKSSDEIARETILKEAEWFFKQPEWKAFTHKMSG